MLGLNPLEQEILDLTNEIARNGFIYFPGFCAAVHKKYREEDQTLFRQNIFKVCIHQLMSKVQRSMSQRSACAFLVNYINFISTFKKKWEMLTSCCVLWFVWCNLFEFLIQFHVLCGTEPFPQSVRAKKYKLHQHFLLKKDFFYIMKNLPEEVGTKEGVISWD